MVGPLRPAATVPRGDDSQHGGRARDAYGPLAEDDRPIHEHEQGKGAHRPVERFRPASEALRVQPPPAGVGRPDREEKVVHVDAAAPIEAGDGRGLAPSLRSATPPPPSTSAPAGATRP